MGLALSADAAVAYVSHPWLDRVVAVDTETLSERWGHRTGPRPRGLAVTASGQLVVVHQDDDLMVFDLQGADPAAPLDGPAIAGLREANPAERVEAARLGKIRQGRALSAAPDPNTGGALIAHVQFVPGDAESFVDAAREADVVDEAPAQTSSGYGSAGTSSGATFSIPMRPAEVSVTSVRPGEETGPESVGLPVRDPRTGEPMTHLIDQPVDVLHHPTHTVALVVGHGSDNVLALNTAADDPMASPMALIEVGRAPKAVAVSEDGLTAWVLNSFDFSVSRVDLGPLLTARPLSPSEVAEVMEDNGPGVRLLLDERGVPLDEQIAGPRIHPMRLGAERTATFASDPWPADVRRGARVFTFARSGRISHAGQFSCATCHFEGTEDGEVWFITDGPRQTPALAERLHDTAPFNWSGSEDALRNNMARTVGRLGGVGLEPGELDDLEQFLLRGLKAPANPHLSADGLSPTQALGEALFNDRRVGCAKCHRGDALTDGFSHDVGTGSAAERTVFELRKARGELPADAQFAVELNTPSLRGLWYTAPYLHDGSAPTLMDVLDRTAHTMGETHHLSHEEKEALVAYLLTL